MKVNKKTECLLYVVLGVFSGIIGSSIMIFIIYNYEYKKEFIKITISIVGLFATFGGAYLGAKISGNNAIKLAKKERLIDDMMINNQSNKNFLRKIRSTYLINRLDNSLINKIIKNSYDLNNYRRAVVTLNQECKYIISITDLDSLSNIVAFEYDNIFKSIDQLSTFIGMHYANLVENVTNQIKDLGYDNFEILSYESQMEFRIFKKFNKYIYIRIRDLDDYSKQEWIRLKLKEFNGLLNKKTIDEINEFINDVKKEWLNVSFKESNQLREYIVEYFKNK
ncbi:MULTISPECIES: hypothetical protein [Staphylococcus]|nr:hypothetical protein [Staphylococcus hominis]MCD8763627.1 hypothetical protein [Staphylococcus hominis]MDS3884014.1 hypothetical protein [Staphylococcus hominis]OFM64533.1 hypothetical protein HMPREF2672_06605 [Staphylococcus sp. HMSC068D07]OFR07889.1 hypothetical protein HMPREF2905_10145 [Staphylococcus sp. HMSC078E07]